MTEMIIETIVQIVATVLLTLIGVLGTWLSLKLAKREELHNIAIATDEATKAAQLTVMELQQTTVEAMKAASEDGKLSQAEIEHLAGLLLEKARAKMSVPATKVLAAAGVDIAALIHGAGEAMIEQMKPYKEHKQ